MDVGAPFGLERRTFQTRLGEVWLWGAPAAFEGEAPVVLTITGAFAAPDALFRLPKNLPEAAVLVGHLPGNHCPPLAQTGVEAYAAAFWEVAEHLARPTVACGASVGGLVALALGARDLLGVASLDPPLLTEKLWPLLPVVQSHLRAHPDDAALHAFAWAVLGVGPQAVEGRDYRPLLDGLRAPTWVLVGEEPLYPQRAFKSPPGYIDEPERALLRSHPGVHTLMVPGVGHDLASQGGRAVLHALRRLLAAAPGRHPEDDLDADRTFMRRAIALAQPAVGRTGDNPAVGCLVVKDDRILAEAATAPGGRPHAEEQALALAGEAARGGVAYVTLEPCGARSSGAASCAERLAAAGVARVVIACEDPSVLAAGRGMQRLKDAGVAVTLGVLRDEAAALYAGYRPRRA